MALGAKIDRKPLQYITMEYDLEAGVGSSYRKKFFEVLRKHSVHKDDPVPEWKVTRWWMNDQHCICTKEITWVYEITNKITKKTLEIGCDCVETWNVEFHMHCEHCSSPLGNRVKRSKERDYVCPSCKRALKKEAEARAREVERNEMLKRYRIRQLSQYVMFWKGPWENMTFEEVGKNHEWAEWFINKPDNSSNTLKYFKEYLELIYEFE